VDPFLLVSNQIIFVAETLTSIALAVLPRNSGASHPTAREANLSSTDPVEQGARSTSTALPQLPVTPELHILPCGPTEVFLWFRLPPIPAGKTFALREIDAGSSEVTRFVAIGAGQESTYLDRPEAPGLHCLEIGYTTNGSWTRCSSIATIRGRAPTKPSAAREQIDPLRGSLG